MPEILADGRELGADGEARVAEADLERRRTIPSVPARSEPSASSRPAKPDEPRIGLDLEV